MDFSRQTTLQYSSVVTAWASGTGGAGILGSFAYAALTDKDFLDMSPRNALFSMNVMVVLFAVALVAAVRLYRKYPRFRYWIVLERPDTMARIELCSKRRIAYISERPRDGKFRHDLTTDSSAACIVLCRILLQT